MQVAAIDPAALDEAHPTLTIAYHPSVARVGERIGLFELRAPGRHVAVSRLEPGFAPLVGGAPQPLGTPFLSRKPFTIAADREGGLTLDPGATSTEIIIAGETVTGVVRLTSAQVDAGVVITLARQVVLVLHRQTVRTGVARGMGKAKDHGLVGASDGIDNVREHIDRVAATAAPVLLRGATGTGKELVAHALHRASDRADKEFVSVNMAAVPASLAASELFGHVRGAFSSADRNKEGFFARADGGTLFLDEIGDAPDDVQAALLRALETGEVQQVGADRVRKVDVRLIAATDAVLEEAIEQGRFRAPLLYRLATHQIFLPPLAKRREDVGRILMSFLLEDLDEAGTERLRATATDGRRWLPALVVARLAEAPWPGNVRQLRNVAKYLATASVHESIPVTDPGLERLLGTALSMQRTAEVPALAGLRGRPSDDDDEPSRPRRRSADISAQEVLETLAGNDYRLGPSAKQLGVSRPTLNQLVDDHPELVRAQNLSENEILAASARCDADLDAMWRDLKVSRRGLKLRMGALGIP